MPKPQRYVLTGAPGAGKTTMIEALRHRGHVYDRSPLCTLALARHLGRPIGPTLTAELDRIVRERTYQRLVFLISPLGFIRHTAARQISYADALAFARVHQEVYEEHGYQLVDVPAGPVRKRVALIEKHVWCAT
ncbi:AAA family ATPase [Micromonospora ureilytica]|uniref:ATPase n=1 Tax=Micromonospora ureilytica TaxID=709868 RepID=A0ABS0JGS0_9ACTN|nr:AAA family ATPase [Micromonospora ureilytica]MBG6065681.1 putative ATPase [Micromonospora ureilytica]